MVLNRSFRKKRSYNRSLPSRKKLNKLPSKHNSKSKSNRKSIKNKIVKRKKYNKKNKKGGSANTPVVNPVTWIGSNDIQITNEPLGGGQFGDVLKGTVPVAIKQCKDDYKSVTCNTEDLPQEIEIMTQLGNHPNIVKLYGRSHLRENVPIAVLEFCNMGSLDKHLSKKSKNNKTVYSHIKQILLDIVSGMQHIHSNNIVHRDLAARNVLLSGNDDFTHITAKVGDFGLAKQMTNEQGNYVYTWINDESLALRWMSPNSLLINKKFDEQSDIWSYGCLCVEILLFGKFPYPELNDDQIILIFYHLNSVSVKDFFLNIFGTSDVFLSPLWSHFKEILTECFQLNWPSSMTFTKLAGMVKKFPLASAVPGAPDSHYTAVNQKHAAYDSVLTRADSVAGANAAYESVLTDADDAGHAAAEKKNPT